MSPSWSATTKRISARDGNGGNSGENCRKDNQGLGDSLAAGGFLTKRDSGFTWLLCAATVVFFFCPWTSFTLA
jgi:hypothetical protein